MTFKNEHVQLSIEETVDPYETGTMQAHIQKFLELYWGTRIGEEIRKDYDKLIKSRKRLSEKEFFQAVQDLYERVCSALF